MSRGYLFTKKGNNNTNKKLKDKIRKKIVNKSSNYRKAEWMWRPPCLGNRPTEMAKKHQEDCQAQVYHR